LDGFRDASTDLLFETARPSRHDTVLDYACGVGFGALALAVAVRLLEAVDDRPDAIDEGRRLAAELGLDTVAFRLADLAALPYPDGAFSLVCCQDALHRLPDPMRALSEMARVTSPGGRVVVVDAVVDEGTDAALNELNALREPAHRRLLSADQLTALAAEAGLKLAERRDDRRTVDLEYWLQAAAVPQPRAAEVHRRLREMAPTVQERLDLAFADDLISFSYDVLALRLER